MTQELEHRRRRLDYVPIGTRTVLIPGYREKSVPTTFSPQPRTHQSSTLMLISHDVIPQPVIPTTRKSELSAFASAPDPRPVLSLVSCPPPSELLGKLILRLRALRLRVRELPLRVRELLLQLSDPILQIANKEVLARWSYTLRLVVSRVGAPCRRRPPPLRALRIRRSGALARVTP